ncbi:hypothetical protein BDV29DRAFT_169010 [Aspergillus leporis]|uniref:Uncharacterized protein n=1 Tax=Aspergillus leporis TaxID=41062 RepID=A0A5N5X8G7_9EURO|nr:hypothetical protein BDV29DRAFT_169010 [Aspergillus leporis]
MQEVEVDNKFSLLPEAKEDVENFIQSCQFNCTGCLYLTLHTNRYRVQFAPRSSEGGMILHQ